MVSSHIFSFTGAFLFVVQVDCLISDTGRLIYSSVCNVEFIVTTDQVIFFFSCGI